MGSKKNFVFVPLLLAITLATGIFIGNSLKKNAQITTAGLNFNTTNKINTIIQLVEHGYVDSVNTHEIIEKTIPSLFKDLDPHSTYIPAKIMKDEKEKMQGNFSGIGVQFSIQEDTVRVIEVISGGPSSKVGLLAGDRIVSVNDSVIAGVGVDNDVVMGLLRGDKGSKVKVGILRAGFSDEFEFEITRGDIPIFSVDVAYPIDEETGYIKVSRFGEQTYHEFMEGVKKLDKLGVRKIIIDLRGNTGGSLTSVIRMVDEFLNKDDLILFTKGLNQPKKTYNATARNTCIDKEAYILIDEYSASASEIFAGALQDNDRGIVIGRRSFGKGLVQEQIPFSDGSAVRLTVARFYTPSGRNIQKPYDEGIDKYYQDLMERVQNGELQESDSIHGNESLKFYTKAGRLVYGGGGITPDIFVPVDTTGYSTYFMKLVQKGTIYQFAYAYADQHRDALTAFKSPEEIEDYLDKNKVYNELIKYAEGKGIPYNEKDAKESEFIIRTQTKAYIARNILGDDGFYPIIQHIDKTLLKAIDVTKENLLVENVGQKP